MLLRLIFRGVSFEFRFRVARHECPWDAAFLGGSFVTALGMVMGATRLWDALTRVASPVLQ